MITVYVWRTEKNWVLNQRIGHAAMDISSTYGYVYISFCPKSSTTAVERAKYTLLSDEYYLVPSYYEDVRRFNNKQAVAVQLNNLNEKSILDRWNELKKEREGYDLITKNCSTVVKNLLTSGALSSIPDNATVSRLIVHAFQNLFWHVSATFIQEKTNLSALLVGYLIGTLPETPESVLAFARMLKKEIG